MRSFFFAMRPHSLGISQGAGDSLGGRCRGIAGVEGVALQVGLPVIHDEEDSGSAGASEIAEKGADGHAEKNKCDCKHQSPAKSEWKIEVETRRCEEGGEDCTGDSGGGAWRVGIKHLDDTDHQRQQTEEQIDDRLGVENVKAAEQ